MALNMFCKYCGKIKERKDEESLPKGYLNIVHNWQPRYDIRGKYIGYTNYFNNNTIYAPDPRKECDCDF